MTNETTSTQQKLVIKLEENAMDSLVHGVEHHLYSKRDTDWKYVILHVSHAVELFLKARLAKHDESLIYKNNGYTVGIDKAINLLVKEAKLSLHKYTECQESGNYKLSGALDALRKARNSIEHKEVALNLNEVKGFLAAAFIFLDDFVVNELGLSLKVELDKLDKAREDEIDDLEGQGTYQALSMAYLFYIQHMTTEGIPILDPGEKWADHKYFVCETCEAEAIAVPDPTEDNSRVAHCFNCLIKYAVQYCPKCSEPYIYQIQDGDSVDDENDFFCHRCMDLISE